MQNSYSNQAQKHSRLEYYSNRTQNMLVSSLKHAPNTLLRCLLRASLALAGEFISSFIYGNGSSIKHEFAALNLHAGSVKYEHHGSMARIQSSMF